MHLNFTSPCRQTPKIDMATQRLSDKGILFNFEFDIAYNTRSKFILSCSIDRGHIDLLATRTCKIWFLKFHMGHWDPPPPPQTHCPRQRLMLSHAIISHKYNLCKELWYWLLVCLVFAISNRLGREVDDENHTQKPCLSL